MRIDRSTLTTEFRSFATEGNGLVIGHPGIGKTYMLLALRDSLKLTSSPHLIVPVESLGDASPSEMRAFLGRDGDLIDLLRDSTEPSIGPGILMFDGFDSARGEKERASILKLIKRAVLELKGSWNVIVSVRTFDAQKSHKLLELFPDREGSSGGTATRCRQFVVPLLRQDELEQAFQQLSGLRALYDQGEQELRDLLRIPFNLWLVERVLGVADPALLSRVTSEVQLLDLYWNYRVRQAAHSEQRNHILTLITRRMVEDHTLSVRKDRVYAPELDTAWHELFSDEVLASSPKNDQRIGFTHNILFDFAVSVHLLENDPEHLAAFIAEEPARPLFLRPSLVFHFTRLWHADSAIFWTNFWGVLTREELHLRQIIRLVLPAVVISEAQKVEDLMPLRNRLDSGEPQAMEAVAFIMQALRVLTSDRHDLWAAFIESISSRLDGKFAWDAGLNISSIVTGKSSISADCKNKCGHFGRQLLSWAWNPDNANNRDWLNRLIAFIAVPIVGKTYATDPPASRGVLEPILQLVDRPNFPIEPVHRLIDEIEHFCDIDPEFTASIYSKIFGFREKSDQTTHMGGYVLPMSSNRRQDYDMCRYSLIQVFPRFLASNPVPAVRGALEAIQYFAIESHVVPYLKQDVRIQDLTKTFQFRGRDSKYLNDGSAIWDEKFNHDQEMQIADMVFQWLSNAAATERTSDIDSFLDFMADKGIAAVLWARLMNVASEFPKMFAPYLWELLLAEPILIGPDARYSLDEFLPKAFLYLSEEQRRAVEQAMLSLTDHASERDKEWREARCNRLLARVDKGLLVTPKALQKKDLLVDDPAAYGSDRSFSSTASFRNYTEEDEFKRIGVDPNKETNARVREAYLPLKEWADKGKNQDQVKSLLPDALKLLTLLQSNSQADSAVIASAWYQLANFASDGIQAVQTPDLPGFAELRQIILLSSSRPEPEPNPDQDRNWNSPVWSQAPRNEAAQILPWLTIFGRDTEALAAIDILTQDPVPSIRFLLYSEIWRLHKTSAGELWPLLERAIQKEQNKVVWQGIALSLWHLSRLDKTHTPDLVRQMLIRIQEDADEEDWNAKAQLVGMVADYAIEGASWATEQLRIWRSNALSDVSSATVSANRLSQYIVPAATREQLEKAKALLLDHLEGVAAALTRMQNEPDSVPADRRDKTFRKLYGVIDQTISRIYFALDVNPNLKREENRITDDAVRRLFFFDALPLLDKVLSFGDRQDTGFLLAPTAHYFMQLLNGVLRFDPSLVLDRATKVVKFSKRFNYNLDALALREMVKLVETLLTDYRDQVQEGESLQNLLDLLDAFTTVGWPEALNLVWRLDEIYR